MADNKKKDTNLISPLVDSLWECGNILWKLLSNNPNKVDWKAEFLALGVKNGEDKTPDFISRTEDKYRIEYLFSLPRGLTVEKIEACTSRIATVFSKEVEYISVERFLNKVKVVVDKGVFEKEIFKFEDLEFTPPTEDSLIIPVGFYIKDGKLEMLCIDLASPTQCHVLTGGMPGYGKTNICKSILTTATKYYTPEQVVYKICDLKGTELPMFAKTKHCIAYTDNPFDTVNIIKDTVREMDDRYAVLIKAKCKDIGVYHEKGYKMPRMILFIDEFADLTLLASDGVIDDSVVTDLARLLQKGRAAGIICIFAMQTAKATLIPTIIRNNIPITIGLGCRDAGQSKSITGDSEKLVELRNRPSGMCMVFGLPRFDPNTKIKSICMPKSDYEMCSILEPYYIYSESIVISRGDSESIVTKKVAGFDLDKKELFSSFQPAPKKSRKSHKERKANKEKLDKLD